MVTDALKIKEDLELPEFAIIGSSVGDCTRAFSTGAFACVYTEISFERKFEYYFIQAYIPSTLIVILSWVSFWIDIEAVPARISLGLLTVLTMTTQASTISARLPRVSYIKGIDVWMSACLLFVFGALIEYSAVNVLYRGGDRRNQGNKLKTGPAGSQEWDGIDDPHDTDSLCQNDLNVKDRNAHGMKNNEHNHIRRIEEKKKWYPKCCTNACENTAVCIDNSSRFIFPGSFVLFNIAYWTLYLLIM